LALLFAADRDVQDDRLAAAAAIQATLCNVHNDWDKRPQGWVPANFMPGAIVKSEQEELHEWAEAVLNGESFNEPDPEEHLRFRQGMQESFNIH
jgi:hypothetical protein